MDNHIELYLTKIVQISTDGIGMLEQKYKKTGNVGKVEIFLFNISIVWHTLLKHEIITRNGQLLLRLLSHLQPVVNQYVDSISENVLLELFIRRLEVVEFELASLEKSNYPVTKQYVPAIAYSCIYGNLQLNTDPLTNFYVSKIEESIEFMMETSDFLGPFCKHTNWIQGELETLFNT